MLLHNGIYLPQLQHVYLPYLPMAKWVSVRAGEVEGRTSASGGKAGQSVDAEAVSPVAPGARFILKTTPVLQYK